MTSTPRGSRRRAAKPDKAQNADPVATAGPTAMAAPAAAIRPLEPIVRVLASAGTGKTHALSTRLIRLLADGAEIDDIFAATFARKAAGEILARVLQRLAAAADPSTPAETTTLAAAIDRPAADATFFRDLLVRVTANIDRLAVGTLDSFFVTCADAARFELGLPPAWSIGTEADLAIQRRRAIHRTISDALAAGPAEGSGGDSPAKLLATLMVNSSGGATTTGLELEIENIVNDLASLHRDAEPAAWDWLSVPRPPKAEDLSAAVETLRASVFEDSRVADARDSAIAALEQSDWKSLLSKGIVPKLLAGETKYQRKPIEPAVAGAYWTIIALLKSVILARTATQTRAFRDLLDHYAATADRLLASDGMVSFDDVTRLVGSAAGDGTLDAARWRGIRFAKHLLIDEFQDTSPSQWRVLERLAEHAVTTSGSFFAVGDRKQAIYGWRGGAAELIDALPEFFAAGKRPIVSLDLAASYRSSPAILDTVNRVFERLAGAEPLADHATIATLATAEFPRHRAAREALPGWVRLRTCVAPEEGQKGTDLLLAAAATRAAVLSRANPGKTVGVLVRTNKAAERVIAKLKSEGIVASAEGGQPLADSPAVELVLSILHLVDHPSDAAARFHVATSPLAAFVGLDAAGAAGEIPAPCVATLDRLRRALVDEGYGPVLERLAAAVGASGSHRDLRRLEQLVAAAREWDLEGGRSRDGLVRTAPFIHHSRTVNVADPVVSPIRVMTIHKAKGLEFDLVVLTDLDRKLVAHPPRVVVERKSPLEPIRRILVHVSKDYQPLLPDDWKKVCAAASDPVIREAIATLYVGLTRAAEGMEILIRPATEKERSIPKTLAGVIRATLPESPDAPADAILWMHGHHADPADDLLPPAAHGPQAAPAARAETAATSLPAPRGRKGPATVATAAANLSPGDALAPGGFSRPIVLRPLPAGQRRRSRPRHTPSAAEGGRTVSASALLDTGSRTARSVGTLLHAWIEQVGWGDEIPGDDVLRRIACREPALAPQAESLIGEFRKMMASPAVAAVLARPAHDLPAKFVSAGLEAGPAEPSLHREQAFALDEREGTLLGIIDRVVLWRRSGRTVAAEVIDFKFDGLGGDGKRSPQPRVLAEKTAFYAPQLQAYRRAVAGLHGLDPGHITCDLVFMRSGDVVPIAG
jgi:ATP-dependent exoDNAse (exonuclease V) beta subunit